jgi:serine/threonine protein phosphatase PrpC
MQLDYAQATDCGRVREHNEDYIGCVQGHGWLFALADGVGGQQKGEVASRLAVETLLEEFRRAARDQPLRQLLPRMVQTANQKVYEAGAGTTIATTLVACALRFDRATIAHVGDSRCYLIRNGRATALTRDHTMVGEQARLGLISEREAAEAETRHVLTRSLGNSMFMSADIAEHLAVAGDILLLCSDGLHGALPPATIAAIVTRHADLDAAARELIAAANERDGADNVSVQLIRVNEVERVGMYRGRPYKIEE